MVERKVSGIEVNYILTYIYTFVMMWYIIRSLLFHISSVIYSRGTKLVFF